MAGPMDSAAWKKRIPRQENLDSAERKALDALAGQTDDQLRWLGAQALGQQWQLPVLNEVFRVDLASGAICTSAAAPVGPAWRILTFHYLAVADRPEPQAPEITFADLPTARSYAAVYDQRTVGRLCATIGQSEETLKRAAESVGGRRTVGGDLAYHFQVFPRVSIRLVWHAPDEEFPPSATLLVPPNIEEYFCSEDVVVLSERLVARLCGKPF